MHLFSHSLAPKRAICLYCCRLTNLLLDQCLYLEITPFCQGSRHWFRANYAICFTRMGRCMTLLLYYAQLAGIAPDPLT